MSTWRAMHKRAKRKQLPLVPSDTSVLGYWDDLKSPWGVVQLSKEQAIACFEHEKWKSWTPERRGAFQLFQDELCMPFSVFHRGLEAALGRSVWTHELADPDRLRAEYLGRRESPNMADIIAMIPAEKLVITSI